MPLERLHKPSREEFERRCVRSQRPGVLSGLLTERTANGSASPFSWLERESDRLVERWESMDGAWRYDSGKVWSPARLGDVLLEVRKPNPRVFGVQMSLVRHCWLLEHLSTSWLAQFIDVATVRQANFWLQGEGNRTHLHFDVGHNFHCLLDGAKRFYLYHPRDVNNLYPARDEGLGRQSKGDNWSLVDVFNVDQSRFPRFARLEPVLVVLAPGDVLYVPTCWWHYVVTDAPSVGVNFWFDRDLQRASERPLYWRWYFPEGEPG
jgi:hypothetical protein